ncbi:MAG: sensor histidine kinase [Thermoplasmatota archaeon]
MARGEALSEKALQAEARVGLLRVATIFIGTLSLPFLRPVGTFHPALAYGVLAVAWLYAVYIVALKPYRRFPILASSLYTTLSDSGLLMVWIYATGSFYSPYWAIMFLSVLAVAYRFSLLACVGTAALYGGLYGGLVAAVGEWPGNVTIFVIRIGYLLVGSGVAGLMSRHSLEQTEAKIEMAAVAERERTLRAQATQSSSLLTAALESTADGLLVVDGKGKITSYNQRFAELWRIPREILVTGSDDLAMAHVLQQLKDPQVFVDKVRALYAEPLAESFDSLDFKDGRVFERYSRPQLLAGQPVGRVWSFRDVTPRVAAERERDANRARAEELDRLKAMDGFKTQFINTAAHELNTPLTPITVQLKLLQSSLAGHLEAGQARGFDILTRNIRRLTDLVADLLDSARYQAGRLTVERHLEDVGALVRECIDSLEDTAHRAHVTLHADVPDEAVAEVDGKRIRQVLYNLVSNAIKFSPGGRVTLAARADGARVEVTVTDTGIGLDPEAIGRLFLPFSQVHDTQRLQAPGTGLGLYISRAIAEAHGGTLSCQSAGLEQGSTFTLRLPVRAHPG